MSLYKQFETDPKVEKEGVVLDYGDFRVTVARAGGANKAYQRSLEIKTRPYRRALATETMDNDKSVELMQQVIAETVVRNWETLVDGKWKKGIEDSKGDILPFNPKNVIATFKAIPDIYLDIKAQAEKVSLFLANIQELEAKN